MADTNTKGILEYYTKPVCPDMYRIQALAALYIGDGLREIAQAIANYRPVLPTQDEIAARLDLVNQIAEQLLNQIED